jgi:NAD(P)-dependent dehydrogenase (short-subunit alcohol dehydrogenase family)
LKRLANKVAVISGAAAGLGRAMAELFAAEGAFVFLADRDRDNTEAVAAAIRDAEGAAEAVHVDVGKEGEVRALVEVVGDRFAALDVLINNAGTLVRKDFRHLEDQDWASILDTHLWGTLRMTRAFLPLLQRAGESAGASVVNFASIMAHIHARQVSSYSASKAAVEGLSRSLAVEFAPYGIRVNAISPGFIPTAMTRQYTRPGFSETLIRRIPMRRFGTPLEIAKVALFLSCEDSSYITGQVITADGGMSINLI